MGGKHHKIKTCDPKFYGRKVNDCGNTIKGLDKLLSKIEEDKNAEKNYS